MHDPAEALRSVDADTIALQTVDAAAIALVDGDVDSFLLEPMRETQPAPMMMTFKGSRLMPGSPSWRRV
jgi:hypothetical protein